MDNGEENLDAFRGFTWPGIDVKGGFPEAPAASFSSARNSLQTPIFLFGAERENGGTAEEGEGRMRLGIPRLSMIFWQEKKISVKHFHKKKSEKKSGIRYTIFYKIKEANTKHK